MSSIFKRNIDSSAISMNKLKCQRQIDLSEDDIIRSRLLFEGDQGSDDRRISVLIKTLNTFKTDLSLFDTEKIFSLLYSIEHSYRILQLTLQMDEREQNFYAMKSELLQKQTQQLRGGLKQNEDRLVAAKQKRANLREYDQRTDVINQLNTRKELRIQHASTLERKRYFEHLQQTFDLTYHQRLKQIAIYMRPIFELDHVLKQDAHDDGHNESSFDLSSTMKIDRPRTYSDSSITSIDGDENNSMIHLKRQLFPKTYLEINPLLSPLENNQTQPLFSNEWELYGTQLVDPLTIGPTSSDD